MEKVPGGSSQGTLWTLLASWFRGHHKGGLRLKTHPKKHKVLSLVLAQVQHPICHQALERTLLASWFCDHHKGGLRLKTHLRKHKVLSIVLAQVQFVIKQSISARSVAFDLSKANPVSSSDFSNSWPSDPQGRFSSSVFSCPGRMFANSIDARLVATRTCMSLPCACALEWVTCNFFGSLWFCLYNGHLTPLFATGDTFNKVMTQLFFLVKLFF